MAGTGGRSAENAARPAPGRPAWHRLLPAPWRDPLAPQRRGDGDPDLAPRRLRPPAGRAAQGHRSGNDGAGPAKRHRTGADRPARDAPCPARGNPRRGRGKLSRSGSPPRAGHRRGGAGRAAGGSRHPARRDRRAADALGDPDAGRDHDRQGRRRTCRDARGPNRPAATAAAAPIAGGFGHGAALSRGRHRPPPGRTAGPKSTIPRNCSTSSWSSRTTITPPMRPLPGTSCRAGCGWSGCRTGRSGPSRAR